MRILLTCNFSPWSPYSGGGQRSTHELATALCREGHDVSVVFTRTPWEHFDVPSVEYRLHWASFFGLRSRRAALLRPLNALSVLSAVKTLHREQPLDVVHGNGEEVVLVADWGRESNVPSVFWTVGMLWWSEAFAPAHVIILSICGALAGYFWYRAMRWQFRLMGMLPRNDTVEMR